MRSTRRTRWGMGLALVGALALSGAAGEVWGASSAASAGTPKTVAGGIVNAGGSVIAGKGFTVKHPSAGVYTIAYGAGTFVAGKNPVVNVTPGTGAGTIVVPGISTFSANNGGLKVTVVLSRTAGSLH